MSVIARVSQGGLQIYCRPFAFGRPTAVGGVLKRMLIAGAVLIFVVGRRQNLDAPRSFGEEPLNLFTTDWLMHQTSSGRR
jgi:hypothetical protein